MSTTDVFIFFRFLWCPLSMNIIIAKLFRSARTSEASKHCTVYALLSDMCSFEEQTVPQGHTAGDENLLTYS